MKRLLNNLFVMTEGAYVSKEGESVLVKIEGDVKLRVPIHNLGGIICFGNVSCSPPLMGHCAENGVEISFLSGYGRFLARVQGPVSGNVLLRRAQYRTADDPVAVAEIATGIVLAKIANSRTVLLRGLRDHGDQIDPKALEFAIDRLGQLIGKLKVQLTLDEIRGVEGDAARTYFHVIDHLVTVQKSAFFMKERSRRPPLDNLNAVLSFLYTLLVHDISAAIESVGLDRQAGFLHSDRPGRPSLALDLMEEFRPFFVDRLALSLINLRQIQGPGFKQLENGAVIMNDETRKNVLAAYQQRKKEEILHPFVQERLPIGLLFHLQALLFARFLRGDLDAYPPFIWR